MFPNQGREKKKIDRQKKQIIFINSISFAWKMTLIKNEKWVNRKHKTEKWKI